jgi:hypothetical protein
LNINRVAWRKPLLPSYPKDSISPKPFGRRAIILSPYIKGRVKEGIKLLVLSCGFEL